MQGTGCLGPARRGRPGHRSRHDRRGGAPPAGSRCRPAAVAARAGLDPAGCQRGLAALSAWTLVGLLSSRPRSARWRAARRPEPAWKHALLAGLVALLSERWRWSGPGARGTSAHPAPGLSPRGHHGRRVRARARRHAGAGHEPGVWRRVRVDAAARAPRRAHAHGAHPGRGGGRAGAGRGRRRRGAAGSARRGGRRRGAPRVDRDVQPRGHPVRHQRRAPVRAAPDRCGCSCPMAARDRRS